MRNGPCVARFPLSLLLSHQSAATGIAKCNFSEARREGSGAGERRGSVGFRSGVALAVGFRSGGRGGRGSVGSRSGVAPAVGSRSGGHGGRGIPLRRAWRAWDLALEGVGFRSGVALAVGSRSGGRGGRGIPLRRAWDSALLWHPNHSRANSHAARNESWYLTCGFIID